MLFVSNIIMLIVIFITRVFCIFATFTVLKHNSKDYYELNPITRKIMSFRGGKILLVFCMCLVLFLYLIYVFIIQLRYPKYIWIPTIITIIITVLLIYDFLNDMYIFRDYRKVVKNGMRGIN